MTNEKKLGIWMDHANAHLMEYTKDGVGDDIITSKFTHEEKESSLGRSEHTMHNKEQHQQSEYYKNLGAVIMDYQDVILFGPTDAKTELLNKLRTDHRFEKIKIEIKQADKMTEHQQHEFVKKHFATHT